jgi:hypothetical protein
MYAHHNFGTFARDWPPTFANGSTPVLSGANDLHVGMVSGTYLTGWQSPPGGSCTWFYGWLTILHPITCMSQKRTGLTFSLIPTVKHNHIINKIKPHIERFHVLTALTMKMIEFCDTALCSLVEVQRDYTILYPRRLSSSDLNYFLPNWTDTLTAHPQLLSLI